MTEVSHVAPHFFSNLFGAAPNKVTRGRCEGADHAYKQTPVQTGPLHHGTSASCTAINGPAQSPPSNQLHPRGTGTFKYSIQAYPTVPVPLK